MLRQPSLKIDLYLWLRETHSLTVLSNDSGNMLWTGSCLCIVYLLVMATSGCVSWSGTRAGGAAWLRCRLGGAVAHPGEWRKDRCWVQERSTTFITGCHNTQWQLLLWTCTPPARPSLKPHIAAQLSCGLAFRGRRFVDSLVLPTHRYIAVTDELVAVEIGADAEVMQGCCHGSRLRAPGEEVKFILTRLKRNSRGGCFLWWCIGRFWSVQVPLVEVVVGVGIGHWCHVPPGLSLIRQSPGLLI
jgi:hypothetical protein